MHVRPFGPIPHAFGCPAQWRPGEGRSLALWHNALRSLLPQIICDLSPSPKSARRPQQEVSDRSSSPQQGWPSTRRRIHDFFPPYSFPMFLFVWKKNNLNKIIMYFLARPQKLSSLMLLPVFNRNCRFFLMSSLIRLIFCHPNHSRARWIFPHSHVSHRCTR